MSDFTTTDRVVANYEVYATTDYGKFKYMEANRHKDKSHVKVLAKKMEREGNLMLERPIEVNQDMFVIDGQNRIAAAELNKMPVYYRVIPNSTISTTISFNTGVKNWGWLDFAHSWAQRGNMEYKKFVKLYEDTHIRFNILIAYATLNANARNGSSTNGSLGYERFRIGEFKFVDYDLTVKLLKQYREVSEAADVYAREFAYALLGFMRTLDYDHTRLIHAVREYGDDLYRCYTVTDFLIELERLQKV